MSLDYKRDHKGHVRVTEFNRHLPRWKCRVCGQWLYRDEQHTIADCEKRVQLPASNQDDVPASRQNA